ncbi:MAG: hypothetical protein IJP75_03335 [Bacteroidaceae bacterium]|nr:hypothetical protein [Bacteroidaceae bacterium]
MNLVTKGLCREIAKCSIDLFKITFVAAFISPWISSKNLDERVTLWSGIIAGAFFFLGMVLHRLADHMEGKD